MSRTLSRLSTRFARSSPPVFSDWLRRKVAILLACVVGGSSCHRAAQSGFVPMRVLIDEVEGHPAFLLRPCGKRELRPLRFTDISVRCDNQLFCRMFWRPTNADRFELAPIGDAWIYGYRASASEIEGDCKKLPAEKRCEVVIFGYFGERFEASFIVNAKGHTTQIGGGCRG